MLDTLPSQKDRLWRLAQQLGKNGRVVTVDAVKARTPDLSAITVSKILQSLSRDGLMLLKPAKQGYYDGGYRVVEDVEHQPAPPTFPIGFDTRQRSRLDIEIPRTHDGLWMLMRWFTHHKNGFALSALVAQIGANIESAEVIAYVRALERGGYLIPELTTGFDPHYRCNMKFVETPRIRADGVLMAGPQRFANMWRSMKMCGYFTALDLASAASLPDQPISREQAARYADDLVAGGYLVAKDRGDEPRLYRLKPAMNTGPAAPVVLRARFVWDANLCRIMGQASSIDEVRP